MRFEMWKSKAQKGAFLVFTAIMIPIIFLCAGFAVDLGNAWAYKSKLQNAADAAVLAGAYQYQADTNDTAKVKSQIDKYINANNGGIPFSIDKSDDSKNGIFYRYPKDGDANKGLLLTLHVSEEAPTAFSKMFGFDSLHVAVVSTVRILNGTNSDDADDVFSYAIIGAGSKWRNRFRHLWDGNAWNDAKNSSIWFHSNGIVVDGKVYANDSVFIDGPGQTRIINADDFSTTQSNDRKLWSSGNNQGSYRLITTDGTPIYAQNHTATETLNINLSEENSKTKNIYKYINDLLTTYGKYGPNGSYGNINYWGDLGNTDGVYICLDPFSSYRDFGDWHSYKTIITYGDILIQDPIFKNFPANEHLTVISLHGNITITGYNKTDNTVKGLFYAPQGDILFKTGARKFEGSLVAQQITDTNPDITFKWNRFDFPGGSTGSGHSSGSETIGTNGKISLYADVDDSYEPAN